LFSSPGKNPGEKRDLWIKKEVDFSEPVGYKHRSLPGLPQIQGGPGRIITRLQKDLDALE
jgi:hypothetical protein